jgi:hypothetical protein
VRRQDAYLPLAVRGIGFGAVVPGRQRSLVELACLPAAKALVAPHIEPKGISVAIGGG